MIARSMRRKILQAHDGLVEAGSVAGRAPPQHEGRTVKRREPVGTAA
jgi:hypothetical protein